MVAFHCLQNRGPMSAALQKTIQHYKAGAFNEALQAVRPLAEPRKRPGLDMLLIAGQSAAKLQLFAEAADYFSRAADFGTEKEPLFRAMSAELMAKCDDSRAALAAARTAVKTLPFDPHSFRTFRSLLQETLSLDERQIEDQALLDRLRQGDERYCASEQHLDNITWCADESINSRITYGLDKIGDREASRRARLARPHRFAPKIRVGYLSNDFCDQHPTMQLFQGVLMSHDASRFDITLFCHTDPSIIDEDRGGRRRYPHIVQIGHLDDDQAADLIRSHEIDILVDLKGATRGARTSLVNKGLAPVQVAYLGFPGSGVGIDCDYVIGDRFVLPESSRAHYHEKFCLMPDSYQANDNLMRSTPLPTRRRELGLPEDRLVFASFNAVRKITAHTVDLWAQILGEVEDSVLWIMVKSQFARENLRERMERCGIAGNRLIFAEHTGLDAHRARLQAADIGLDSFPYNGHTTTSDALWAGVPVPTYYGRHFASRVSASLLHATGLGELVAATPADYVDLTVRLARDPAWRQRIRKHLTDNRRELPLFDTARFTRHLERGFEMMVDRALNGMAADHLVVEADAIVSGDAARGARRLG